MPAANSRGPTAIIPNGQDLSAAVDLRGKRIVGLLTPATWTAAALTFQVSVDGVEYKALFDEANEVSIAAFPLDRCCAFSEALRRKLVVASWVQLRSGTVASPVAQGGNRTFVILTAGLTEQD